MAEIWSEVTVAGVCCDVLEPANCDPSRGFVLYLHDATETRLPDLPAVVDRLTHYRLPALGPRTGRSWWNDKTGSESRRDMSAERIVLDHVVPMVAERWRGVTPRIGLLGIEMGGQGALRWAYKHPTQFPVAAAIAPAIDHQNQFDDDPNLQQMYADPEAVRQDTATLHIHPLNWPRHQFFCCHPHDDLWWEGADRLRMKLSSLGIPHECDLETQVGATADEYASAMAERAVKFLVDRFQQELRRV